MKHLLAISLAVVYLKVPIIGDGTESNHYRPDVPTNVTYNAIIPTDKNGIPLHADVILEIPDTDQAKVPVGKIAATYTKDDAKTELQLRGDDVFPSMKNAVSTGTVSTINF